MSHSTRPDVTLSLTAPRSDDGQVQVHEWSIEVTAGPDKGRELRTFEPLVRIGTDSGSDLVLTDPTVSRRHAEIERTKRGFVVRDLGSRNGTFLGDAQILGAIVQPKDRIDLGKTRVILRQEAKATAIAVTGEDRFGELFGVSEPMRAAFAILRRVAGQELPLLVEGETGTGKELAARAVHAQSGRRHGPFRIVDCSLLTEDAADRELLPGDDGLPPLFAQAKGGTLFLDELCELPLPVQPRLLRSLETVGDVRVIASSNRNVDEEVRQGRLRKDLFFRVAVARVKLPPLRARRDEIPALARHLLTNIGGNVELTPQTLALFESYEWPGNVRELRNVLERGALMHDTGSTQWLDFLAPAPEFAGSLRRSMGELLLELPYHSAKDRVLGDFERIYFAEVMKASGFDMQVAERRTGLSMQSLYRLLKKNGLRLKDLKNDEGAER